MFPSKLPLNQLLSIISVLLLFTLNSSAQNTLKVISQLDELRSSIQEDPKLAMIELKSIVPNIQYELKYASSDNFTKVRLYPAQTKQTFLRKEPADALAKVATELAQKGIGIWVWDAYRPYHITQKFWELIQDERYVAHPAKGSGHNRGIAIDMTLYHLKTGQLLDMPTGFDDFSEKAHHGYQNLSTIQLENRELLRGIMEKYGFIKFQTEWWHYYWPNGDQYDVLDFNFKQINTINRDLKK